VDASSARQRRRHPNSYRRRVVAETWRGTESVSEVTRRHDLNANWVFKWRQRYPELSPHADATATLIPIVAQSKPPVDDQASVPDAADASCSRIGITLAGDVDPGLACAVLATLR